jgi:hypothetical protein
MGDDVCVGSWGRDARAPGGNDAFVWDYLRFAHVSPGLEPPAWAWLVRGLPGVGSMSFMLRGPKFVIRVIIRRA